MHSKTKAQILSAERETLEGWISVDPSRPVYTAIRAAFIQKFPEFYTLAREATSSRRATTAPVSPQKLTKAISKLTRLDKECVWLAGLLFNRSNLWAVQDWRKPAIIKFLLRSIRRSHGGRPATKLRTAVQATEFRLSDPKQWTWRRITAALCDCRRSDHTIQCQDNLRREVIHLTNALKKLGCNVRPGKNPA